MHRPVRIGLLIDSFEQPAWVCDMLRVIKERGDAEVVVVVENAAPSASRPLVRALKENAPTLLARLYLRLDRMLFRSAPDALAPRSIEALVGNAPCVRVVPRRSAFSDRMEAAELEKIRAFQPDLMVRLGFRILRGGILTLAPCGVWSFHHGDNAVNRGGPAGFWEVFLNEHTTGSILQILTEDLDDGLVLARSWSQTDAVSVTRNRNNLYWKSLFLLPRELHTLAALGIDAYLARVRRMNRLSFYSRPLYALPRNLQFLPFLIRHFVRTIRYAARKTFFNKQWRLYVAPGESLASSLRAFRAIVPPRDRFWADPHAIELGGKQYVFVEEFEYRNGRGHISVLELSKSGEVESVRRVLEKPYHLSYPFVFEAEGALYLIPESCAAGAIDLYRCDRFPDTWTHDTTLMKGVSAVDATVFFRGGLWWMFCGMKEHPGGNTLDETFLFYADGIRGPWKPHPMNPIVSDVRRARPAGAVFEHAGRLFRPGQDNSVRYGYGVRFFEITTLSTEEYEEVERSFVEPLWRRGLIASHTFSRIPGLTVFDACAWRWKLRFWK